VDVNEYIARAERKIYEVGLDLLKKSGIASICDESGIICDLNESINIVSDSLTSSECVNYTITTYTKKYSLDKLDYDTSVGIGAMAIDDDADHGVFGIYF
jgi:hypothetical protein